MPPLAIDCGSGGTRVFRLLDAGVERLPWPDGEKAPVLSHILASADGRAAFAAAVSKLPSDDIFVGATAGVRHALDSGAASPADIEALRTLLPAGASLELLSPLDEARFELAALRRQRPGCSAAMLSMGGKSMQLGSEGRLVSLPFAMHLGHDLLKADEGTTFSDTVGRAAQAYAVAAASAIAAQKLEPLGGLVVGVTDVMDVAEPLGLVDQPPLLAPELVVRLESLVAELRKSGGPGDLSRSSLHLLARALALAAVARTLLAPTATLIFPSAVRVSWTEGYFVSGRPGRESE